MRRIIISGVISNSLEWYSYALYGYFASTISKLFFPLDNQYLSMIATFGVFAAGFVMRPIGAALFGYIGDRYGRRMALSASVMLMAIPTASIGLLPTYASIGIAAPITLTIIRLLQGFALGGAFSGSMTFVIEHAPYNRRGFAGSTTMFSMIIGMFCGALSASIMSGLLENEAFELWGWRIPFLVALPAGLAGLYIRTQTPESPEYEKALSAGVLSIKPIREVFTKYLPEMLIVMGICLSLTVPFYILTVFMNSFMVTILGYPLEEAMLMNSVNMFILLVTIPSSALLSDIIGRKRVLVAVACGYLFLTYPIFILLVQGNFLWQSIAQALFSVLVGCFIGPIPALMVELFPTKVRYTGMAISYNLSISIFGGTAPMLCTLLTKDFGTSTIVAVYVMIYATLSLIALYCYKDKYAEKLQNAQ